METLASNQSPTLELNSEDNVNSSLINQENSSILYPNSNSKNDNKSSLSHSSTNLQNVFKSPPPLPTPSSLEKSSPKVQYKKPSQFIEQKNSIIRKHSIERKIIGEKDNNKSLFSQEPKINKSLNNSYLQVIINFF